MKTALYTTFYPSAKPYLQTWANSVATQSDQTFDLWIAVDDVDTKNLTLPRSNIHWLYAEANDTPASLRHRAFEEIVQAYDAVIFVDSDDILLPERVATAKETLKSYDVYGCALKLIDTNGKDLEQTFTSTQTDWANLLSKVNIFGLSNTAYRTETLANCLPFPDETVMVDWLLITNSLQHNTHLYFDQTPHMLYRQYPDNTAKVLPPYSPNEIQRATALVLQHYEMLAREQGGRGAGGQLQTYTRERQLEAQQFSASIADKTLLASYTKALNALQPVFLWWECVANEKLRGLWDIRIGSLGKNLNPNS
jgi:nicotinic acid mononucleotide adenylyltransferase